MAHHALATVVYCLVGYALWLANQREATSEAPELTDLEKRLLHYQSHPTAWVETRLPTTPGGWLSFGVCAWMAWNWSRRAYLVKKILDARHAARAGALNRARLGNADIKRVGKREAAAAAARAREEAQRITSNAASAGTPAPPLVPGDALNPCSDPRCLRCRPSAHEAALARNALRLRDLMKEDPSFAEDVSPDVLALASKSRARVESQSRAHKRSLQAPTVFRLPGLCAVPIHERHGEGCVKGARKRRRASSSHGASRASPFGWREEKPTPRCACAAIWGDESSAESDVAILERAAPAISREVREAAFAPRSRKKPLDNDSVVFAPFDPAVRKGGDWSAVYLYRNGVKDRRNCEAFPAATAAVERLRNGCFGGGDVLRSGCAFGSAYISKLEPNTLITPHCGPSNARLRCSLGLVAPRRVAKRNGGDGVGARLWVFFFGAPSSRDANARGLRGETEHDDEHDGCEPKPVRGRRTVTRRVVAWIVLVLSLSVKIVTFPILAPCVVLLSLLRAATKAAAPFLRLATGEGLFVLFCSEHGSSMAPACELIVANRKAEWREGECVLFDDSFVHSAEFRRGRSEGEEADAGYEAGALAEPRVVLIVDLWHPELSEADRRAIRTLYPPGMGAAAEAHAEETEGRKQKLAEFAARA